MTAQSTASVRRPSVQAWTHADGASSLVAGAVEAGGTLVGSGVAVVLAQALAIAISR